MPDPALLRSGEGSGLGREKRREDWRSRAVGELTAFDMVKNGAKRWYLSMSPHVAGTSCHAVHIGPSAFYDADKPGVRRENLSDMFDASRPKAAILNALRHSDDVIIIDATR